VRGTPTVIAVVVVKSSTPRVAVNVNEVLLALPYQHHPVAAAGREQGDVHRAGAAQLHLHDVAGAGVEAEDVEVAEALDAARAHGADERRGVLNRVSVIVDAEIFD
jgi:hypothetical protein